MYVCMYVFTYIYIYVYSCRPSRVGKKKLDAAAETALYEGAKLVRTPLYISIHRRGASLCAPLYTYLYIVSTSIHRRGPSWCAPLSIYLYISIYIIA